ncbi:MAG: MGMT family protein [Candidatus Latescibacteria bacterium]|nr:MGMT family protein [Candidatus Latescibacterota bacterium]
MKLLRESPVEFLESIKKPPEKVYITEIHCGIDTIAIAGTSEGLLRTGLNIPLPYFIEKISSEWDSEIRIDDGPFTEIAESLKSYYEGSTDPIKATVQPVRQTPFTLEVHRIITRIPFGGVLTYGDIAKLTGRPGAARAVGTACGKNQVLLVVPCHRVVASQGLGGFGAGGLEVKKKLLEHEHVII